MKLLLPNQSVNCRIQICASFMQRLKEKKRNLECLASHLQCHDYNDVVLYISVVYKHLSPQRLTARHWMLLRLSLIRHRKEDLKSTSTKTNREKVCFEVVRTPI